MLTYTFSWFQDASKSRIKTDVLFWQGRFLLKAIKQLLQNRPRDLLLFTMGINNGLRIGDILKLKAGQVQGLKPGDVLWIREQKTDKDNVL